MTERKKKRKFDDALAEDSPAQTTADMITDRQGLLVAPEADEGWMQNRPADTWKDTALDAAGAWANSGLQGFGINSAEALDTLGGKELGDELRMKLQAGRSASPYATTAADMAGAITTGVPMSMLGLGPAASGFLGGVGATEGDLGDKAMGGTFGAITGKVGDEVFGAGKKALGNLADKAKAEWLERNLVRSGAQEGDLAQLDKLGGRREFAEAQDRLGLRGSPRATLSKSQAKAAELEAQRAGIVGDQPPDVDTNALAAAVFGSADRYPGITPVRNAAAAAARDADAIGVHRGGAAPWDDVNAQRQYYGDKTNFASGTPEANVRKGVYGAYNDEMGDALTLKDPGAGEAWRQAGKDEQYAIELGEIAQREVDRARNRDFSLTGAGARMARDALTGPAPARLAQGLALGAEGTAGLAQKLTGPAAGRFGAEAEERVQNSEETTEAALTLLQTNPKALGKYAYEISQAAASPQRNAVNAAITKLIMTDENFRTQILPQLTLRGEP